MVFDPATHRVFVTDRADHRIEIFDENGKFLGQWSTGKPSTPQFLYMAADRSIWIADGTTAKIIKFDLTATTFIPGEARAISRELCGTCMA